MNERGRELGLTAGEQRIEAKTYWNLPCRCFSQQQRDFGSCLRTSCDDCNDLHQRKSKSAKRVQNKSKFFKLDKEKSKKPENEATKRVEKRESW
jgi:hypothetical protein